MISMFFACSHDKDDEPTNPTDDGGDSGDAGDGGDAGDAGDSGDAGDAGTTGPTEKVEAPTINAVDGATFIKGNELTMTCTTPGADIHYTINGSIPTESSSIYQAPLSIYDIRDYAVNGTVTVKAVAIKSDMDNSDIVTVRYTILKMPFPPTNFSVVAGSDPKTEAKAIWTVPGTDGNHNAPIKYLIEYIDYTTFNMKTQEIICADMDEMLITGLTQGTSYTFSLYAVNDEGKSDIADPGSVSLTTGN